MPLTSAAMWIATLAIAGIPPLAGFFSKDEILPAVFSRAHGSPLAEASAAWHERLRRAVHRVRPRCAHGLLTAIYMTRLMLLAFTGENRTGADGRRGAARGTRRS
jgi:NADH-quinone oxidoreductase subunit L